jgi:hypothetical protein
MDGYFDPLCQRFLDPGHPEYQTFRERLEAIFGRAIFWSTVEDALDGVECELDL